MLARRDKNELQKEEINPGFQRTVEFVESIKKYCQNESLKHSNVFLFVFLAVKHIQICFILSSFSTFRLISFSFLNLNYLSVDIFRFL